MIYLVPVQATDCSLSFQLNNYAEQWYDWYTGLWWLLHFVQWVEKYAGFPVSHQGCVLIVMLLFRVFFYGHFLFTEHQSCPSDDGLLFILFFMNIFFQTAMIFCFMGISFRLIFYSAEVRARFCEVLFWWLIFVAVDKAACNVSTLPVGNHLHWEVGLGAIIFVGHNKSEISRIFARWHQTVWFLTSYAMAASCAPGTRVSYARLSCWVFYVKQVELSVIVHVTKQSLWLPVELLSST